MRHLLVLLITLFCSTVMASKLERIEVFPTELNLASKRSKAQLVITGWLENGEARDLTRLAKIVIADKKVADLNRSIVIPIGDGETDILIRAGEHSVKLPVRVSRQSATDPIRFTTETLATLTKQGCNAGSCHGSPHGKAGFSLSLFGFDAVHDELSLIRGGLNRRVNVLAPDESLMLKKPLLKVPHVGGKKLTQNDSAYHLLRQWIFEGARGVMKNEPKFVKIVVYPKQERVLRAPHLQQQLSVQAYFDNDTVRDVTDLATYQTSKRQVATVESNGLVLGRERGSAAIMVRYLESLESVYFTVVPESEGFAWLPPQENNGIDRLVNDRLKLLQIEPALTCSDSVFLRRVHLDLTGLLPPTVLVRSFLSNDSSNKRTKLINDLLNSREFARFQALQMADLLRINPEVLTDGRATFFAKWIEEAIHTNQPFDKITRQILTASGDSKEVAPANYYASLNKTENTVESTVQIFMGARIQCAKCHNHPFENWTQDDYYSIGAVFNRINRDKGMILMNDSGEMTHPRTGKVMDPWGGKADSADPRLKFAEWLTAADNPWFARVMVNRIWSRLMGRGIVEPVDDFRSSNPPSNVPLLNELANSFATNGFNCKQVYRKICNSQVYQRTTQASEFNAEDNENFSHARVRLLTAEQLHDAIGYVTGSVQPAGEMFRVKAELESKERERTVKIDTNQSTWEESQTKRLSKLDFHLGGQWSLGFFKAKDQKEAHEKAFIEETEFHMDLAKQDWQLQPDWEQSRKVDFPENEIGARYIYENIWSRVNAKVKFHFVADDGVRAWHNGRLFYDQIQILEDPKTQYAETELSSGLNYILFKVNNKGGAFHFTVRIVEFDGKTLESASNSTLPGHITGILAKPVQKRSTDQQNALRNYHQSLDDELVELRHELALDVRLQYASQRPWPEQTDFLKAFGQPKRTSPCACERSSEPTLEQALQLLNGRQVYDKLTDSNKQYASLTDHTLVEALYLAAFSRYPSDLETGKAREYVEHSENRDDAIRDLVWALINTQEFMFQH